MQQLFRELKLTDVSDCCCRSIKLNIFWNALTNVNHRFVKVENKTVQNSLQFSLRDSGDIRRIFCTYTGWPKKPLTLIMIKSY